MSSRSPYGPEERVVLMNTRQCFIEKRYARIREHHSRCWYEAALSRSRSETSLKQSKRYPDRAGGSVFECNPVSAMWSASITPNPLRATPNPHVMLAGRREVVRKLQQGPIGAQLLHYNTRHGLASYWRWICTLQSKRVFALPSYGC